MRRIKYFLFLLILIPFININALTLCDDTELPDIPDPYGSSDYIIYTNGNDTYLAILYDDYVPSINNEYLVINSQQSYQLSGDSWLDVGNDYVVIFNTILATTNNVTENDNVVYEGGYNINCSVPAPIPNDFSIINTIASAINTMVTDLQQTFSLTEIFIGLFIFNFLFYILCYIVSHLE